MISRANSWTSVAKFSAGGIPGSKAIVHPRKCLEPEQYLRRSRARCLVGSRIARGVPDTVEARLARVQGPEARRLPSGCNQKRSNRESPAELALALCVSSSQSSFFGPSARGCRYPFLPYVRNVPTFSRCGSRQPKRKCHLANWEVYDKKQL
jgi:hypothetical protein